MKWLTLLAFLAAVYAISTSATLAAGPPPGASQTSYKDKLSAKFGRKPIVAVSVLQFNNVTIQKWLGAMREASEFHGIDLRVADGQNDAARQADQNDNFIAQKVDLILIDPVDAKGILPVVERINNAQIPVINFDVKAAGGHFATFVGHDWLMSGIMSGLQIVDATGGEGNVILVEGSPGTDAQSAGPVESSLCYPFIRN